MTALDISDWLADLENPDETTRNRAALGLYRYGRALGEAATTKWRGNLEFAAELTGDPTVGIAVAPARFDAIRVAMGGPPLADVPPDMDAVEFELRLVTARGDALLDILTTRAPGAGGAIARFLEKRGEGIQQVECPVRNVDRATALLREHFSVPPVYSATRIGANGARVNFFLASTPDGKKVLIELVEALL